MEARIQTGTLPAVGWSVLFCLGFSGFVIVNEINTDIMLPIIAPVHAQLQKSLKENELKQVSPIYPKSQLSA
jgi:hypothetical protein